MKFRALVTTNVDDYISMKMVGDITDADVGKPVKLDTTKTDTYTLCADGDGIDGFIVAIEPATADGLHLCTIQIGGRKRVEVSGAANIGDPVEAGAVAAAGTAETNGLPLVSTHTYDTTSAATLEADLLQVNWRIISGATTDGVITTGDLTAIIERF